MQHKSWHKSWNTFNYLRFSHSVLFRNLNFWFVWTIVLINFFVLAFLPIHLLSGISQNLQMLTEIPASNPIRLEASPVNQTKCDRIKVQAWHMTQSNNSFTRLPYNCTTCFMSGACKPRYSTLASARRSSAFLFYDFVRRADFYCIILRRCFNRADRATRERKAWINQSLNPHYIFDIASIGSEINSEFLNDEENTRAEALVNELFVMNERRPWKLRR